MTDEPLEVHPTRPLPPDTIPNLQWMIPLMLDDEPAERRYEVHVIGRAAAVDARSATRGVMPVH